MPTGRSLPVCRLISVAMVAALLCTGTAAAQVVTTITPDTAGGLTTGTTITRTGPGGTSVLIHGGRYVGPTSNPNQTLFHSFERFDLGAGDVAFWTGTGSTANVRYLINRVTGGDRSEIYGRLQSTAFPNADFYFINPAGIVFGEDFSIRVPQSLYVSTAAALNFSDGTRLLAATGNGSTFSVAAPESFGFLPGAAGDLSFTRARASNAATSISVGPGRTAHFSAANIEVANTYLSLNNLRARLAATGTMSANISLDARAGLPELNGALTLQNSVLEVGSNNLNLRGPDAALGVSAGDIRLIGGVRGDRETSIRTRGGFGMGGDMELQASRLYLSGLSHIGALNSVADEPFTVTLRIRDLLQMRGTRNEPFVSQIGTSSYGTEVGNSIIRILGANATLDMQDAAIDVRVGTRRSAGALEVDVGRIVGTRAAFVGSSNFALIGVRGGDLSLTARSIELTDSRVQTSTFSADAAGSIRLRTDALTLNGTHISSLTGAAGDGGLISISAGQAQLANTSVVSLTAGSGHAGGISVAATGALGILGSQIATTTSGIGNAGSINLSGASVGLFSSLIQAVASDTSTGNAGAISIRATAGSLSAENATVETSALGLMANAGGLRSGSAGSISLTATHDVRLTDANILSTALARAGAAGSISIAAGQQVAISATGTAGRQAVVSVATSSQAPLDPSARPGISITGRQVSVQGATERLDRASNLSGRVRIVSETSGGQPAASINVQATDRLILDRMDLISQSARQDSQLPPATGRAGDVTLTAQDVSIRNTIVEAASGSSGDAGSIRLDVSRDLVVTQASVLSSAASGRGRAGSIDIAIGRSGLIDGFSRIDTDVSGEATGSGGIRIHGERATLTVAGLDPASSGFRRSAISSSTGNAQEGGRVTIDLQALRLLEGGGIFAIATSGSTGNAGSVIVNADTILMDGPLSGVQATALGSGNAGSISVAARRIALNNGAEISTNAVLGRAGDITISMPEDGIFELRGDRVPSFVTTSSGPGTGGRINISRPRAVISDGGAILALGQARGADVDIVSGYLIRSADATNSITVDGDLVLDSQLEDVSEGADTTETPFADAYSILIGQCAGTRSDGKVSLLELHYRGPYPTVQTTEQQRSCIQSSRGGLLQ